MTLSIFDTTKSLKYQGKNWTKLWAKFQKTFGKNCSWKLQNPCNGTWLCLKQISYLSMARWAGVSERYRPEINNNLVSHATCAVATQRVGAEIDCLVLRRWTGAIVSIFEGKKVSSFQIARWAVVSQRTRAEVRIKFCIGRILCWCDATCRFWNRLFDTTWMCVYRWL